MFVGVVGGTPLSQPHVLRDGDDGVPQLPQT